MSGHDAQQEKLVEAYLEERKALVESQHKSSEQYDTHVLTLAAGALGISLVFLKDIAPSPIPTSLCWLRCAWGAYVSSLLLTLSSFQVSTKAFIRQRDILDDLIQQKRAGKNHWTKAVVLMNILSLTAFIIGTATLITFALENIKPQGAQKGNEQAIKTNATATATAAAAKTNAATTTTRKFN